MTYHSDRTMDEYRDLMSLYGDESFWEEKDPSPRFSRGTRGVSRVAPRLHQPAAATKLPKALSSISSAQEPVLERVYLPGATENAVSLFVAYLVEGFDSSRRKRSRRFVKHEHASVVLRGADGLELTGYGDVAKASPQELALAYAVRSCFGGDFVLHSRGDGSYELAPSMSFAAKTASDIQITVRRAFDSSKALLFGYASEADAWTGNPSSSPRVRNLRVTKVADTWFRGVANGVARSYSFKKVDWAALQNEIPASKLPAPLVITLATSSRDFAVGVTPWIKAPLPLLEKHRFNRWSLVTREPEQAPKVKAAPMENFEVLRVKSPSPAELDSEINLTVIQKLAADQRENLKSLNKNLDALEEIRSQKLSLDQLTLQQQKLQALVELDDAAAFEANHEFLTAMGKALAVDPNAVAWDVNQQTARSPKKVNLDSSFEDYFDFDDLGML